MSGPGGLTEVVVGRVGRPHGVRGEVSIEVRTDEPALRFTPGAVLRAASGKPRSLTVDAVRPHGDRLLITFAEVRDRTAAEAMRGAVLVADVESGTRPDDPDEFYDRQLIGLRVRTTVAGPADPASDGAGDWVSGDAGGREEVGPPVGTVVDLRHLPAQDLLEIRLDAPAAGPDVDPDSSPDAGGPTVLVPFVRDLVPVVDLDAGWLAVAAVPGLLDPEQPGAGPGALDRG